MTTEKIWERAKAADKTITREEALQLLANIRPYLKTIPSYERKSVIHHIKRLAEEQLEDKIYTIDDAKHIDEKTKNKIKADSEKNELTLVYRNVLHNLPMPVPGKQIYKRGITVEHASKEPIKPIHLILLIAMVRYFQVYNNDVYQSWLDKEQTIRTACLKIEFRKFLDFFNTRNNAWLKNKMKVLRTWVTFYESKHSVLKNGEMKNDWQEQYVRDYKITTEGNKQYITIVLDQDFVNNCIVKGLTINIEKIIALKSDRAKELALKLYGDLRWGKSISEVDLKGFLGMNDDGTPTGQKRSRNKIKNLLKDMASKDILSSKSGIEKKGKGNYSYSLLPYSPYENV